MEITPAERHVDKRICDLERGRTIWMMTCLPQQPCVCIAVGASAASGTNLLRVFFYMSTSHNGVEMTFIVFDLLSHPT